MRRIQRQMLRAQGLFLSRGRYQRAWCSAIVGSDKNPSKPGPGWKWKRKSVLVLTGKQEMRSRRARRRLHRELMESGGGL